MIQFLLKCFLLFLSAASPIYSAWFTSDGKYFEECMENRRNGIQNEIQLRVAAAYCRSKHPPDSLVSSLTPVLYLAPKTEVKAPSIAAAAKTAEATNPREASTITAREGLETKEALARATVKELEEKTASEKALAKTLAEEAVAQKEAERKLQAKQKAQKEQAERTVAIDRAVAEYKAIKEQEWTRMGPIEQAEAIEARS